MQYISAEHQKAIGQRYRTASILVFAYCASVFIFMLVARLVRPQEIVPGSERLREIVPAVVIVLAFAVIVLRRVWMSRVIFGSAMRRGVDAVLSGLLQMTIICAAISELVAIFGLVFCLLTGDFQYTLILGGVSLMLLLYTAFPRRGEWERAVIAGANAHAK